jgi:hypothetical protein
MLRKDEASADEKRTEDVRFVSAANDLPSNFEECESSFLTADPTNSAPPSTPDPPPHEEDLSFATPCMSSWPFKKPKHKVVSSWYLAFSSIKNLQFDFDGAASGAEEEKFDEANFYAQHYVPKDEEATEIIFGFPTASISSVCDYYKSAGSWNSNGANSCDSAGSFHSLLDSSSNSNDDKKLLSNSAENGLGGLSVASSQASNGDCYDYDYAADDGDGDGQQWSSRGYGRSTAVKKNRQNLMSKKLTLLLLSGDASHCGAVAAEAAATAALSCRKHLVF